MLLVALAVALLLPVALLAVLLSAQPVVPEQLSAWPSLGTLYLQLLRAAVKGKKPPSGDLKGKPIKVRDTAASCVCVCVLGFHGPAATALHVGLSARCCFGCVLAPHLCWCWSASEQVQLTTPVRCDLGRYQAFLKLVGFKDAPARVRR